MKYPNANGKYPNVNGKAPCGGKMGISLEEEKSGMIRLIATDLDETILPEGTFTLNPEYPEVIRALSRKGILFVAASGRHSTSIRRLLKDVQDDVVILAGNGSVSIYQGRTIDVRPLDYNLYLETLSAMRKIDESLILTDHAECVWTDSVREDLVSWIRDGYRVRLERCPDLEKIEPPILKCAMYVESDAAHCAAKFRDRFGDQANIVAAGAKWVDVVANGADKGSALGRIQEHFGIRPEETAAFGDNENDIGMLQRAEYSFAVENARPQVKEAAREVIGPMKADAVLEKLKGWL